MAHFLRGKQAGVQRDFSAGLAPQLFAIDEVIEAAARTVTGENLADPILSR